MFIYFSKKLRQQNNQPGQTLWSSSWGSSVQLKQSELVPVVGHFYLELIMRLVLCILFRCIESESEPPTKSVEKFLQYSCYIGSASLSYFPLQFQESELFYTG